MGYITYIFDLFFKIATNIIIPIPISPKHVVHLSIFSILIGLIVLGLIIWFVTKLLNINSRLLNFEFNYALHLLGREQDSVLNLNDNVKFKQIPKNVNFKTRSSDYANKHQAANIKRK